MTRLCLVLRTARRVLLRACPLLAAWALEIVSSMAPVIPGGLETLFTSMPPKYPSEQPITVNVTNFNLIISSDPSRLMEIKDIRAQNGKRDDVSIISF